MKKIRCIYYTIIISIVFIPKSVYAVNQNETNNILVDTSSVIESQEENFGIRDFLNETEKYMPDFVKGQNIDVSNIFNQALTGKIDNKKYLKLLIGILGSQAKETIKVLANILLIVLIHSILKSLIEGLENSDVSKIIYYVQCILIVTIVMSNFSDILNNVKSTIENLVGFSELLIPLLVTLMTYTGSITTTAVIEPILLFLIEFISNIIKTLILPTISIIVVLIIISKITEKIQISKLGNFFKSSIIWFLGVILTVFVGVVSLEGSLTSSVDGVTAKTAKAAISSLIPVVRKSIR